MTFIASFSSSYFLYYLGFFVVQKHLFFFLYSKQRHVVITSLCDCAYDWCRQLQHII